MRFLSALHVRRHTVMVSHVIGHVNFDQMSKPVSAKTDHSKVTALVK